MARSTSAHSLRRRRLARPGSLLLALLVASGASARDVSVSGRAALRETADPAAPVVTVVAPGATVHVHEARGGWVLVSTGDNRMGWISGAVAGSSLRPTESDPAPATGADHVRLGVEGTLRATPASGARESRTVPRGEVVRVIGRLGTWLEVVDASGRTGWLDVGRIPVSPAEASEFSAEPAPAEVAEADTSAADEAEPPSRAAVDARSTPSRRDEQAAAAAERRAAREAAAAARSEALAARQGADRAPDAPSPGSEPEEPAGEEATAADASPAGSAAAERAAARRAADEAAAARRVELRRQAREGRGAGPSQQPPAAERAEDEVEDQDGRAGEEAEVEPDAEAAERAARREEARRLREEKEASQRREREEREAAARLEREEKQAAARRAGGEPADTGGRASAETSRATDEHAESAARREAEDREAAAKQAREQREAAARASREEKEAAAQAAREEKAAAEQREREEKEAAAKIARDEKAAAEQREREEKAAAQAERERAEQERIARIEAERNRPPAAPIDIPPAIPVQIAAKAPAERDEPDQSPLVAEGPIVTPAPAGTSGPADAQPRPAPAGFEPFDAQRQLDRSVSALHEDPGALDLSLEPRRTEGRAPQYIDDQGRTRDTAIVTEIAVRVNDEILTNADYERRVQETLDDLRRSSGGAVAPADEDAVRRRILGRLVEQLLLVDQGKVLGVAFDKIYEAQKTRFMEQAKVQDDLELLKLLDATGRTWDDFRRELLREAVPLVVLKREVMSHVVVPEEDIESHYRLRQEEWSEEGCVRLREIVLQPEPRERTRDFGARLESVLSRIESGEDFCAVVRDVSRAPSADDCGLLPQCFRRSMLDEKVALVAFRMKPGDVEPIQTEWGYHVIRLEEAQARRVRPLAEVRNEILERLRLEASNEEVRRYIDRLRESARIEVAPRYRRLLEEGGSVEIGANRGATP